MIEQLKELITSNQFASGGLLMVVVTAILAYCRSIPAKLYNWFLYTCTFNFTVWNSSAPFYWIEAWLANHEYQKKCKRLHVSSSSFGLDVPLNDVRIAPDAGSSHWLWIHGCFCVLKRTQEDIQTEASVGTRHVKVKREGYSFRIFPIRRSILKEILSEGRALCQEGLPNGVQIMRKQDLYSGFSMIATKPCRSINTILTHNNIVEDIVKDLEQFYASEKWYNDMGIPWHRGILLHGSPGNGKTSTLLALAGHFDKKLCIIPMNAIGNVGFDLFEERLVENSFIVLEDVDCFKSTKKRDDDTDASFLLTDTEPNLSVLLNALDGPGTPHGLVVFMTTNHKNKIDPALIRPGRIDRDYEFCDADKELAGRIFSQFFKDASQEQVLEFSNKGEGHSMATLQGHLLKFKDSIDKALIEEIKQ